MVLKAVRTVALFLQLCFAYVLGNIAVYIPCLRETIKKGMDRKASIVMPVENYWHTLFTWPMMQTLWKYGRYEIYKNSKVDHTAPNPRLVCADPNDELREVNLHDLVKPPRLLVVVFGSWTCPVFVTKLDKLHAVQHEFSELADFVVVYVQEAHPDDGWRMENNYEILKHRSTKERIKAAQSYRSLLTKDIPLFVDTIDNKTSKAYSGCPNRIIVIEGNTLTYQNGPGPTSYNFDGLRKMLSSKKVQSSIL